MDLGRQRAYTCIRSLPIKRHVVANRNPFYFGHQDNTPHDIRGRLLKIEKYEKKDGLK